MAIGITRQNPAEPGKGLFTACLGCACVRIKLPTVGGALSLVKDAWFPGFSANAWVDGLLL